MRVGPFVVLVVIVGLAGCTTAPPPVSTTALDAPPLREVLPSLEALPAGFVIGWEQEQALPEGGQSLTRVYDHAARGPGTHHGLRAGIQRFDSGGDAQRAFERIRDTPTFPTPMQELAATTLLQRNVFGTPDDPENYSEGVTVFAVDGVHLAWVSADARGEPLITDPRQIALTMIATARG